MWVTQRPKEDISLGDIASESNRLAQRFANSTSTKHLYLIVVIVGSARLSARALRMPITFK
jgi:hypothetical protein